MLWIDGEGLIDTLERGGEKDGAVLDEAIVDIASGAGERIEGVCIDEATYCDDDTARSSN